MSEVHKAVCEGFRVSYCTWIKVLSLKESSCNKIIVKLSVVLKILPDLYGSVKVAGPCLVISAARLYLKGELVFACAFKLITMLQVFSLRSEYILRILTPARLTAPQTRPITHEPSKKINAHCGMKKGIRETMRLFVHALYSRNVAYHV